VMADVFVIVNVNVLVCELNSQTTVAVENWLELTPAMVMVSARTLALAATITSSAANENTNLNGDIERPPCTVPQTIHLLLAFALPAIFECRRSCGAMQFSLLSVCVADIRRSAKGGQRFPGDVTEFQYLCFFRNNLGQFL
jgi:hypothetical protein